MATISVPAETLIAGPTGYRVQVIDYDTSAQRFKDSYVLAALQEQETRR